MWLYDYNTETDNPYRNEPFVQISHLAHIDNGPQWEYPRHVHENEFEIALIISGEGTLYILDTPYKISKGSVVVIPPGVHHRYCTEREEGMNYCNLRFLEDGTQGELISFYRSRGSAITNGINYFDVLLNNIRLMLTIHRNNDGVADGMMQSIALGYLQWIRYLLMNDSLTLRLGDRYGIGDILEYIEKNKEKRITLDSLSYQFGISTSQLNRVFRKAYNITPINYLIKCRVAYATEYLLKTNLSIAEIGVRVGYDNPNHFINMFTKRIGCTPDEYRRINGGFPLTD